jgi:S1-C subfamily serine protease
LTKISSRVLVILSTLLVIAGCRTTTNEYQTNIELPNGGLYTGYIQNGKPHGTGTLTYSASHKNAGTKYVGEFFDGKPHGKGIFAITAPHLLAGSNVVGGFRNGKFHGQIVLTYSAPHKSAGVRSVFSASEGKRSKKVTISYSAPHKNAGGKYVGEGVEEQRHGEGVFTHADGRVEEGLWKYDELKYLKKATSKVTSKNVEQKKQTPSPETSISGSGFFVSKLGHIVTNQHVVSDCNEVTVGDSALKQAAATVLETDRRNDLALLKISSTVMASADTKSLIQKLGISIEPKSGDGIIPLSSNGLMRSEDVELGEDLLVAGYPYGKVFSDTIKVTKGIVSANRGLGDDTGQFQMDAAVQPGNSGGPIYDDNGNIVGVVVSQLNKMKFAKSVGSIPENVNFGIKASTVRQFLSASGLPTKWSSRTKSMSTKDLAKIAKMQTVMVMCYR